MHSQWQKVPNHNIWHTWRIQLNTAETCGNKATVYFHNVAFHFRAGLLLLKSRMDEETVGVDHYLQMSNFKALTKALKHFLCTNTHTG